MTRHHDLEGISLIDRVRVSSFEMEQELAIAVQDLVRRRGGGSRPLPRAIRHALRSWVAAEKREWERVERARAYVKSREG